MSGWNVAGLVMALWIAIGPTTARAQGLGDFISPGTISRPHQDIASNCLACHSVSRGVDHDLCMGCHDSVRDQVASRTGYHADKPDKCESCHREHKGLDPQAGLLIFRPDDDPDFDHTTTGFPLEGKHARAACKDCHTEPGTFTGLRSTCESCHDDPHGKNESKRDLLQSCDQCHNPSEWKALPIPDFVFDHGSGAQTDYTLEGAHIQVSCLECHFDWRFVPVEHDRCQSCHEDPHRANFGKDTCEDCHGSPKSWVVPGFDHDRTPYPLVGQHEEVECFDCHAGSATTPLSYPGCEGCHEDVHAGQFKPRNCEDCHAVETPKFGMQDFDHDKTDFPLVGLHVETACEECHGGGKYVGLPFDDCDACHVDEHEGRFEPTMCQRCHTPSGFKVLSFNHDDTNFPHSGKHKEAPCNGCHEDFQWIGFPYGSCADCHEDESPHQPGILGPETCDSCHDTDAFVDITFDHARNTKFDLAPAHTERKCADCHESVDMFSGLNKECTACHQKDRPWGHYDGECGTCHEASEWFPGGLGDQDHSVTGFPLRGQHARIDCETCHSPERARGEANPQCSACHAKDDSHRNLLGDACDDCHNDMSWFRVRWRHGTTGFPLRGGHKLAECIDCHPSSYTGTPNQCFRCHAGQASNGPHHQSAVFRDCELCHREYNWSPYFSSGLGR